MLSDQQVDHYRTFGFVKRANWLGPARTEALGNEVASALRDAYHRSYAKRDDNGISGHYLPMTSRYTPVDDLASMRAVQRDADSPRRMVCFLAHLVAEKAMKAILIDAGVTFAKTHNLLALYDSCRSAGRPPGIDSGALSQLSPWTIDGRYADDLVEADHGVAERLASFASELVAAVRSELYAGDEGPCQKMMRPAP